MAFRVAFPFLLAGALLDGCAGQPGSTLPAGAVWNADSPLFSGSAPSSIALEANLVPAVVGVSETGIKRIKDPNYGPVWGYFNGVTSKVSEIVHLSAGSKVVFKNVDTVHKHTAAFLGDATSNMAPWPASFNGGTVASVAGTDIGTTGWNTGTILIGAKSLVYNAGPAGYYMIGCKYHYQYGMRTVVVVQ